MRQVLNKLGIITIHKKMMIIIVEIIVIGIIIIEKMIITEEMIGGVMTEEAMKDIENGILRGKKNKKVINKILINIIIEMT